MDKKTFEQLVKTEQSAMEFFKQLCWENEHRFCIRCNSFQLYRIAGDRYRCKSCGYTFHDFSGRWINQSKIGLQNWLKIIRHFEQGISARLISKKVLLSYPTVLKTLEILRLAIIANSMDSETWLDHVYFSSASLENKQIDEKFSVVFGIKEKDGKVQIDILENISVKTILDLEPIKLGRSSIYYTGEYSPYQALVFHDHAYTSYQAQKPSLKKAHKTFFESDFWNYAKTKLSSYRGVSSKKLPLYLKELEFRYNHRDVQTTHHLSRYLVSFVPKG